MVLIQNEHFGYKNEHNVLKNGHLLISLEKIKTPHIEVLIFVNQGAAS